MLRTRRCRSVSTERLWDQASVAQPEGPSLAHMRRQSQLVPDVKEDLQVDVVAHIVVKSLSHDPLVGVAELLGIVQVVFEGEAPSDVVRQSHFAAGLGQRPVFHVVGYRHGPEQQWPAVHALILGPRPEQ